MNTEKKTMPLAEVLAKATARPWTTKPEEAGRGYIRIRGTVPGGRYKVANVLLGVFDGVSSKIYNMEAEEARSTAALIVHAANQIEALVEALEGALAVGQIVGGSKEACRKALREAKEVTLP